jgi:regulator of CtrA degradation
MESRHAELTPRLIDSLYVEAMLLADEARAYFDSHGREDRLALDPLLRVGFSCESLKVTTRLMHVIAWLLTRRAVAVGEIARSEGRHPERRLGEAPESDEALLARLPENAVALIRSSRELFDRVRRIEEGDASGAPQPSPARGLISRLQRSL